MKHFKGESWPPCLRITTVVTRIIYETQYLLTGVPLNEPYIMPM